MNLRLKRIEKEIKKIVSNYLVSTFTLSTNLTSFYKLEISNDLKIINIYISSLDNKLNEHSFKKLYKYSSYILIKKIKAHLNLKKNTEISIHFHNYFKELKHINNIFDSLQNK